MRIVNEWNHNSIKITAFHMNGRYSLKFEYKLLEQWLKFRDGQVENIEQLKNSLGDEFYHELMMNFDKMDNMRMAVLNSVEGSYDFDTII